MKCFEGIIIILDIPNQENGINKEELKTNCHLNIDFKLADNQSIKLNSSNQNTITLIVGSLYLVGEILNPIKY